MATGPFPTPDKRCGAPGFSRRGALVALGWAAALGVAGELPPSPSSPARCDFPIGPVRAALAQEAAGGDTPVNYTSKDLERARALVAQAAESLSAQSDDFAGQGLTVACVREACCRLTADPEYYYVSPTVNLVYTMVQDAADDCPVESVELSFEFDRTGLPPAARLFEASTFAALSWAGPGATPAMSLRALHDYLVRNVAYDTATAQDKDTSVRSPYTAYGALALGTAVCDGYARAYQLLAHRLGIACRFVASDAMDHSWNLTDASGAATRAQEEADEADAGDWYFVDVTWDDPIPDSGADAPVRTDAFLVGDQTLQDLDHYGWDEEIAVPQDCDWVALVGDANFTGPADPYVQAADPHVYNDVDASDHIARDGSADLNARLGLLDTEVYYGIYGEPYTWLLPGGALTRAVLAVALHRLARAAGLDAAFAESAVTPVDLEPATEGDLAARFCLGRGLMACGEQDASGTSVSDAVAATDAADGSAFIPDAFVRRDALAFACRAFWGLLGGQEAQEGAASSPGGADEDSFAQTADRFAAFDQDWPALEWAFAQDALLPREDPWAGRSLACPAAPATRADAVHALMVLQGLASQAGAARGTGGAREEISPQGVSPDASAQEDAGSVTPYDREAADHPRRGQERDADAASS